MRVHPAGDRSQQPPHQESGVQNRRRIHPVNAERRGALSPPRPGPLEKTEGQNVEYIVFDDKKSGRERVQLRSEDPISYDPTFYKTKLIRVAESVL